MLAVSLGTGPGVPGIRGFLGPTAWHSRIFADQLTLFKPGWQIMPPTLLLASLEFSGLPTAL